MSLVIRKPGILSTIQDLGRTGSRSLGINPGGAMDRAAARILNTLLGNDESAAVLEAHFPAPEIEFDQDTVIAVGGADFDARMDDVELSNWSTALAKKGSVLRFSRRQSGNRAYIAVHGGFRVDNWLGSSSTNLSVGVGGFSGRRLLAGDRLECSSSIEFVRLTAGRSLIPRYSRFPTVRIMAGNESEFLTAPSERTLMNEGFTLTRDCDRMGYRLTGKPLHLLHDVSMVSSAVCFGTIQLLPDGQLIVLMADHQTTGGYPRIGNVISADLPLLAQLGPGDGVSFELVSVNDAERLSLRFDEELNLLRVGCRLRTSEQPAL